MAPERDGSEDLLRGKRSELLRLLLLVSETDPETRIRRKIGTNIVREITSG